MAQQTALEILESKITIEDTKKTFLNLVPKILSAMEQYKKLNMENQENISIKNSEKSTRIYSTINGEIKEVVRINDCFNLLPHQNKLETVSTLLDWCSTLILINK
jgi:hypothetical protein